MPNRSLEGQKSTLREISEHVLDLPHYLAAARDFEKLNKVLTDFNFIESKSAAGMVGELEQDYERALLLWPEGKRRRDKRIQHDDEMERYIRGLASFAKSYTTRHNNKKLLNNIFSSRDPIDFPIPRSLLKAFECKQSNGMEYSGSKVNYEYERLKSLSEFIRTHSHALDRFSKYQGFCTQQAYNVHSEGLVAEIAEAGIKRLGGPHIMNSLRPDRVSHEQTRLLRGFDESGTNVRCVAMSPDTRFGVSGGDNYTLCLWDLRSGGKMGVLRGHPDRIFSVVVTPDFQLAISGDWSGWVCVWDLSRKVLVHKIKAHKGPIYALSLTPDGRLAISGGEDRVVRVWDVKRGDCAGVLTNDNLGEIRSLLVTPNGQFAVSGHTRDPDHIEPTLHLLNIWDLAQNRLVRTLWQFETVSSLDMTPDGRLIVSGDWGGKVNFWSPNEDEPIWSVTGHDYVNDVAMSADGSVAVSLGRDHQLSLWDVDNRALLGSTKTRIFSNPSYMVSSADCRYVLTAGLYDSGLRIWDLAFTGVRPGTNHRNCNMDEIFFDVERNRLVTKGYDGCIYLWDSTSGEIIERIPTDIGFFSSIEINLNASLLACANREKGLLLVNLDSERSARYLDQGDMKYYYGTDVTPDGQAIISTRMGGTLEVWDVKTRRRLYAHRRHLDPNRFIYSSLCPDGRFAGVRAGSIWRLFDTATNRPVRTNMNLPSKIVSPDGRLGVVKTESDGILVYDVKTACCVRSLKGNLNWFEKCRVSPTGRQMAFTESHLSDSSLFLWNWRDNALQVSDVKHGNAVIRLTFTPDGQYVVSLSVDQTLRVWHAATGNCLAVYYCEKGFSSLSDVTPDGRIAVSTQTGDIQILELKRIRLDPPYVTATRLWRRDKGDPHGQWDNVLTVICPWCGQRSDTPSHVVKAIREIESSCGLRSTDAPCLSLPSQAWEERNLLCACTHCGSRLRFNPFLIDNKDGYFKDFHKSPCQTGRTDLPMRNIEERTCTNCHKIISDLGIPFLNGMSLCTLCMLSFIEPHEGMHATAEEPNITCRCCNEKLTRGGVRTTIGWICDCCCQGTFEMVTDSTDLESWGSKRIIAALYPRSKLSDRLCVLWRFSEMLEIMRTASVEKRETFLRGLAESLGFVTSHPLASLVRQLALECNIQVGDEMVRFLFEACKDEPWQLHANVLIALGSIAPEASGFKELLERSSREARPEVRMRVPMAVEHYETNWTRDLLAGMFFDSLSEVSEEAFEVIDKWDIEAGIMGPEEKRSRTHLLPLLADPDPDVRRFVLSSLVEYNATWARKLAERLSHDADEGVREEAERLLANWSQLPK